MHENVSNTHTQSTSPPPPPTTHTYTHIHTNSCYNHGNSQRIPVRLSRGDRQWAARDREAAAQVSFHPTIEGMLPRLLGPDIWQWSELLWLSIDWIEFWQPPPAAGRQKKKKKEKRGDVTKKDITLD